MNDDLSKVWTAASTSNDNSISFPLFRTSLQLSQCLPTRSPSMSSRRSSYWSRKKWFGDVINGVSNTERRYSCYHCSSYALFFFLLPIPCFQANNLKQPVDSQSLLQGSLQCGARLRCGLGGIFSLQIVFHTFRKESAFR